MKRAYSFLLSAALLAAFLAAKIPSRAITPGTAPDYSWDLGVLDRLAQTVAVEDAATGGCIELRGWQVRAFRDRLRALSAKPAELGNLPNLAVQSPVVLWPGGVVPYVFDGSVTAAQQRIFLDAAADWTTFAAVSFVVRTSQTNYILVKNVAGLGGGRAAVGVTGPAQTFDVGTGSWNRNTLIHEMGHTLGIVHEHQRPDRNTYVTIQTANILPGSEGNFVILPTATTATAYDFLSVMHYRRDSFSTGTGFDTIVPKAGYESFLDAMGNQFDRSISTLDRVGMAATYGAGSAFSTVVTNTRDGGPGSLTAALYRAVDAPGSMITFNIPTSDPGYDAGSGTWTIRPTDQLPKLGRLTTLDATTQPGGAVTGPKIVLDGLYTSQAVDVFAHGLKLTEDRCNVRGLAIRNFDGDAIRITDAGATENVITRCLLGCNAAGNLPATTGLSGIAIYNGAQRNRIGGPAAADRNIISGSIDVGLRLAGAGVRENLVQGNFIGLRPDGATALANANSGIQIDAGANTNVVRGNVISGNSNYGVALLGANVSANRLEGNLIGTNAAGTAAVPNVWSGVGIFTGANGNVIGGSLGARNVISGNLNNGIAILGTGVSGNVVSGNFIGMNASGTSTLGNSWSGISIGSGASGNHVGGSAPGSGNVISGNLNYGIILTDAGTSGNVVAGNLIGLNAAGSNAVGNGWTGVGIFTAASNNLIGGDPAARNVISGNGNNGVAIAGVGTTGNFIRGNTIGYDITGTLARGNQWEGVSVYGGATNNQIGGTGAGAGNRIGNNGIRGIVLFDAGTEGISILGNSIFSNADAGIEMYNGSNGNPAAPTLSSASIATQLGLTANFTGQANATYRFEFFASRQADFGGFGEGRLFLGARDVTTNASGVASPVLTFAVTLPPGSFITATATSPAGSTSRFSNATPVSLTDGDNDGLPNAWETAFGLNPASPADAALDRDGDGFSATAEYLAGTNPSSPTSRIVMQPPAASGNDLQVGFTAVAGRPFYIEKSLDLVTWRLWADNLVGTGAAQIFTDTAARDEPMQFYRSHVGF